MKWRFMAISPGRETLEKKTRFSAVQTLMIHKEVDAGMKLADTFR